ncbi:APS kinase [Artemisia annua]|uniref:APS kinase n=1 Tax=Artemisia annua TaxID=35608 RepID=A0A2U1NEH9_ARTAN|nr:APS kinase [Artemisia annua]
MAAYSETSRRVARSVLRYHRTFHQLQHDIEDVDVASKALSAILIKRKTQRFIRRIKVSNRESKCSSSIYLPLPYKNIGTSSRNATLGIALASSNDATTTYLRNDYFSTRWYMPQVMWIFVVTCALTRALHAQANMTHVLDGDNVKHVRYCDPTFKPEDRAQNIRIGAVMLYKFIIIPLTF